MGLRLYIEKKKDAAYNWHSIFRVKSKIVNNSE